MSTCPACEAPVQPLSDDGNRSPPGDAARADRRQSHKRPFPDDNDEGQINDTSPHMSKKARTDNRPNESDAQSPSPSPLPIVDYHIPDEHSSKPMLQEWQNDVHEAVDRSEAAFRYARQAYTKFRKNRLPSPALSDEESAGDSDTDEFGCSPIMLNLENDDPEVEDVFGAAYAQRIRGRSRQRAPAIRPQKVFSPPPKEGSERDTPSEQRIVEKRGAASRTGMGAGWSPRRQAQGLQYSTRLRKAQTDDRNIHPPKRGSQLPAPLPSQATTKTPEMDIMDECNIRSSVGRRFTRRSRQQIFYELDRYGKPRII